MRDAEGPIDIKSVHQILNGEIDSYEVKGTRKRKVKIL